MNTQTARQIGLAMAFVAWSLPAQAASIFTFGSEVAGLSTIAKTVDGITLTFTNPSPGPFDADGDGFFIDNGTEPVQSFNLSVDVSASLDSFNVGFADGPSGATWDIVGTNGSSLGNSGVGGFHLFTGALDLLAGEVYSVSANFTTTLDQYFQVDQITLTALPDTGGGSSTSTPLPGSLMLLMSGFLINRQGKKCGLSSASERSSG